MEVQRRSAFDRNAVAAIAESKAPQVAFGFWVVKILATTLGETGGDAVSMSLGLGYAVGSALFIALFFVAVFSQIRAKAFHPALYWFVVIATTTAGTTMADLVDRSMGIGYLGGASLLLSLLIMSLSVWYWSTGSISVASVTTRKVEAFYWSTILLSQTLGTALGDWVAATDRAALGLGYEWGALIFGAGLIVIVAIYFLTSLSRTLLFWAAFVLTRPLGATLGDFLDKPVADGGLALDRFAASGILMGLIVMGLFLLPQKVDNLDVATNDLGHRRRAEEDCLQEGGQ